MIVEKCQRSIFNVYIQLLIDCTYLTSISDIIRVKEFNGCVILYRPFFFLPSYNTPGSRAYPSCSSSCRSRRPIDPALPYAEQGTPRQVRTRQRPQLRKDTVIEGMHQPQSGKHIWLSQLHQKCFASQEFVHLNYRRINLCVFANR